MNRRMKDALQIITVMSIGAWLGFQALAAFLFFAFPGSFR